MSSTQPHPITLAAMAAAQTNNKQGRAPPGARELDACQSVLANQSLGAGNQQNKQLGRHSNHHDHGSAGKVVASGSPLLMLQTTQDSLDPEAAARAMVGAARATLVILMGVLVLKLTLSSGKARALRKRARSRSSANHDMQQTTTVGANDDHKQFSSPFSFLQTKHLANFLKSSAPTSVETQPNESRNHQNKDGIAHNKESFQESNLIDLNNARKQEQITRKLDTSQHQASLPAHLPPGPFGLPFLGYLPFLGKEPLHLSLTQLSEQYGPIYQIFLGKIRVVVVNDANLTRQAFREPVFNGRPDTQLTRILQGYGIINSEGPLWKEQRAFLHSVLRRLGVTSLMGGSFGLEAKIQNQVREFVNDLSGQAKSGQSCEMRPFVARSVSSVVGSIVMNSTYEKESEKFDRLIELMTEGFKLFTIAMPLDFIPILRFLPGVSWAYNKIKQNRQETSSFFHEFANQHRRYLSERYNFTFNKETSKMGELHPSDKQPAANNPHNSQLGTDNDKQGTKDSNSMEEVRLHTKAQLENVVARDLVDAYIIQQKRHEADGKLSYFSDRQLVQIMNDIFSAGLETVTSTIEWSILFMILNPDCQKRVQEEIERVIGNERLPQLDDLSSMPYTEATIFEVLRRSSVVTLGNAHATLEDATIGGYLIPKGSQVLPNLYAMNMDAKLWQEPGKFDPTRFLVNERACKPDHFIPFSVGRRICLGDLLAKMQVFIFLAGLLQRFDLSVAPEDRDQPPKIKGIVGLSNAPVAFRVALRCRANGQTSFTDRE